ncbi:MAG: hypothetical protein RIR12_2598, partial [Bacteroidota bacterium]
MNKKLHLIFLCMSLFWGIYNAKAQCTGICSYTYNGSGGTNFTLNTGEQLCITGNASGLNISYNGTGTKVCVAAGVTWNADGSNFGNTTLEVYGTLIINSANFNSDIIINVYSGGVLNYGKSDFNGNGK